MILDNFQHRYDQHQGGEDYLVVFTKAAAAAVSQSDSQSMLRRQSADLSIIVRFCSSSTPALVVRFSLP